MRLMTLPVALLSGAALCAAPGPTAPAAEPPEAEEATVDPRDGVKQATISLDKAIASALRGRSGRAVEASLECWRSGAGIETVYEIDLLTETGTLLEVRVHPGTGEVLGTEEETDEAEAASFARALRQSELTLAQLVETAGNLVKGQAVSASLEADDGPECEVIFANGRYLIEADLEARAGHLIELELLKDWHDEDDDENDDGDDDADDEDGDDDVNHHDDQHRRR